MLLGMLFLIASCDSQKKVIEENLPKDIALKPIAEQPDKDSTIIEQPEETSNLVSLQSLNLLKKEIDDLISEVSCDDPYQWRTSPFGAKPCGGPSEYIAYPKKMESQILPKITKYNSMSSLYNKQNGLISDCMLVPPPSGIKCENGKAVLEMPKPPDQSLR